MSKPVVRFQHKADEHDYEIQQVWVILFCVCSEIDGTAPLDSDYLNAAYARRWGKDYD